MVPKIKLKHESLLAVISYNAETGEMKWRDGQTNWRHAKHHRDFGYIDDKGRKYVHLDRRAYAAHRLAWFYVTSVWPDGNVTPINGDYLDIRFSNLSLETPSQTAFRSKDKPNTSGHRGVSWDKSRQKWMALTRRNGKFVNLGRFATKEEAQAAYEASRIADGHAPIETAQERAEKRAVDSLNARYRVLWKRTQRLAGGLTGWTDIAHFRADLGQELKPRMTVVPMDPDKVIGPGNWKWDVSLYSQFDTSTREGRNAYERAVKARNPYLWRDRNFRQNFGITLAQYQDMLVAQGNVCACCGLPETTKRHGKVVWLAVDHCHARGSVRGLLCNNCNQGLGLFKDNPAVLRKAADYLERHAKASPSAAFRSTPAERKGARSIS